MRRSVVVLVAVALGGCGSREELRPAAGRGLPQKPALSASQPTVEELLTPAPIARPVRSEELLRRSEERRDDRFDLPPPG